MNFRALFDQFKEMKHYFIVSTLVFVVGIILGYGYYEHFENFLKPQVGRLQDIVGNLSGNQLLIFLFIFLNNTFISILVLYAGAFFALFPLYLLVSNGLMLGYVAAKSLENGGNWLILAKSILPHGIIELPAILLASAFGIRFGFLVIGFLIALPSKTLRPLALDKLLKLMKASFPMMLLLVAMLLTAAIIESTVTFALVGK